MQLSNLADLGAQDHNTALVVRLFYLTVLVLSRLFAMDLRAIASKSLALDFDQIESRHKNAATLFEKTQIAALQKLNVELMARLRTKNSVFAGF
ncbi:MAG: hypothetical protein WBB82_16980 [Limnothrix sp.]